MLGREVLIALPTIAFCLFACGPTPSEVNKAGHNAYANGDYATALEVYEGARERVPGSSELYYNVGNSLYRMEMFEESLREYDVALEYARGELRSRGFFNRGNAAFQSQMFDEAVEAYKEVLRMNPDDIDAKHNLELALRQMPPETQPPQDQTSPTQPPPQAQLPPREPQTEPLTGEQARQALEAVGEGAQTLQGRRQQTLVSPEPPTVFDW